MARNPNQRKRPKQSEVVRPDLSSQDRYRKLNPGRYLVTLAKQRAKRDGREFDLGLDDLVIPTHCPLLGIELDQFHPNLDNHCSLDRIDSTKGYVRGNVMVISHRANRIKSNATAEELVLIGTNLKQYEVNE